MIKPGISIRGKITFPVNLQGKTNASIIKEYPALEDIEIIPTIDDQKVKSDFYGINEVTVKGVTADIDEDIKPENIKVGINILGIDGGYEGIDTSDATATSNDILQGKTAYANNEKIEGTMQKYDGSYEGNVSTGNEWEEIFKSSIDNSFSNKITELPDGITSIRDYAFYKCKNLVITELPKTIKSIGSNAFYDCDSLIELEIPKNITTIPGSCFGQCGGLKTVKILGNITEIGGGAFYYASAINKLILPNVTSVPTITSNTFMYSSIFYDKGYIYVPDDLVESFKTATYWSSYKTQIKPISELEV